MARNQRGRIVLRHNEWVRLLRAAGHDDVDVGAMPSQLSRSVYRTLLEEADTSGNRSPVPPRPRRPRQLLTVLVVAVVGLAAWPGCASTPSYQIDPSERLVGRTRAPLHHASMTYSTRVLHSAEGLLLQVDQVGQCPTVEQLVFERPDVPARRMRTRYATHVDPTLVPCEAHRARDAEVVLQHDHEAQLLGRTDVQGLLVVPLDTALPAGNLYVNGSLTHVAP